MMYSDYIHLPPPSYPLVVPSPISLHAPCLLYCVLLLLITLWVQLVLPTCERVCVIHRDLSNLTMATSLGA